MSAQTCNTKGAHRVTADTVGAPASHTPSKRHSILLVASLLTASLLAWGGMQLAFGLDSDQREVQVVDGDGTTKTMPLGQNGTYTFTTSFGTNVIEVQDGSVHMASSDCPNHDCVGQGSIDSGTDLIVCMPHQLIVSIVDEKGN